MANTKDLRQKIASVRNTQQTTRAMKMVSAAKLRRAQHAIVNARPYANRIHSVISKIAATKTVSHPLFDVSENPQKILMVVLTSDRGLCGSFNSGVLRAADAMYKKEKANHERVDLFCIGRRAGDYFRRRGVDAVEVMLNLAKDIRYEVASAVAERVVDWFLKGDYDEVRFVFNEFKSAISQKVVSETLLPIRPLHTEDGKSFEQDIIFEPAPELIMEQLLKKHFAIQVYRVMQESIASEHGARMNAMENATKNAAELIKNLTLTLNKIRQAAITTELIEITSGAEALKA
ncbi:MAG TPA: ATP synthase F1 subunit gamma [Bdellovibrionales bacterium]|nr:ATP synthase F1 subunit gamma [Bdellovibrionales bacterium]